ncbi:MAG: PmoA family protein [Acidobacteriota bacterium]|nr:PmoA family protein [Acidobacteriota bacterium]
MSKALRFSLISLAAAVACLSAQVRFSADKTKPDPIEISIDGQPFATFHYGSDAGKPFIAPLRSASGKIITRRFPMENVPGESRDHLHHRGLWFSYDDVNGVKFWENDPSYTKPNMGRIVVRDAKWKDGDRSGTLTATMEWRDPKGKVLLVEDREMVFYSDPKLRTIDFNITLTAAEDVTIGDTKEGAFAIRLADNFTEKRGLKIVDADGRTGMAKVWGKRSNWVDYSADVDGEKIGVAMFDHPQNPHHPTYWHARDYGLFALNPFGQNAFDPKAEESVVKLSRGQQRTFRWRVIIHPGDADTAHVADLYKDYAAGH